MLTRLFTILLFTSSVMGAVIHVPADVGSIQPAIDGANEHDTILVAPGVYSGTGNWYIDFDGKNVSLLSEAGSAQTIIDVGGTSNGFYLYDREDSTSVIRGFTVQGAISQLFDADGAGICCRNYSKPIVQDCIFIDNVADYGGAVFCGDSAAPHFIDCVFMSNSAIQGGAVYTRNANPTFTRCVFMNNVATFGGAMYTFTSKPSYNNCTFVADTATTAGSLFFTFNGSPKFDKCIVAYHSGPDLVNCTGALSDPTLVGCDVFGNASGDWVSCIASQQSLYNNFSSDPQFCNLDSGLVTLSGHSPCRRGGNASCALVGAQPVKCGYVCGDADGDSSLTMSDLVALKDYYFGCQTKPVPLEAADPNCDGRTSITDLLYLANFLYSGGPAPCCP